MTRNFARVAIVPVAWLVCSLAVVPHAAAQQERQVTATGTSTITAQPEILRVTVQLQGEGPDVKDALAKLDAEKQAAKEKLAKLGVAEGAVKFAEPTMGEAPLSAQQRQMQMIMRMQRGAGAQKPTTTKVSVSVASVMTADVPLKAGSAEELLIAATDVQGKLGEAFKSKAPEGAASPQEQEVLEEMMGQESDGSARPGEPSFLYVHKITAEEQEKALADAFAKARESAAQIAKAVGLTLGDVRTVSATSKSGGAGADDENAYFAMMANMAGQAAGAAAADEATSTQPGPVTSKVTVTTSFALK